MEQTLTFKEYCLKCYGREISPDLMIPVSYSFAQANYTQYLVGLDIEKMHTFTASPDILIPSEEYLDLAITEGECADDWDDIRERQLAISYGFKWANWALCRLKEMNKHVNFKTK